MPVPLPPRMADDELMAGSVMDQRDPLQKLADFLWGRTLSEKATNAFTGGMGMVYPKNLLSRVAWKIAQKKLEPEIVESVQKSAAPVTLNVVPRLGDRPKLGPLGTYSRLLPTQHGMPAPLAGNARVYLPRIAKDQVNPFSVVGHEMTHAAQDLGAAHYESWFPGLGWSRPDLARERGAYLDPGELLASLMSQRYPKGSFPWEAVFVMPDRTHEYRYALQRMKENALERLPSGHFPSTLTNLWGQQ